MLQGHEGEDALTRREFETTTENKQQEWWCWREATRKLPKTIALAVAGLIIYASLFAFRSQLCWQTASDCWRTSADSWSASGGGEVQESAKELPEAATGVKHLQFGIAASAGSWPLRQKLISLWWRKESMRGFVWLDGEVPSNDSVETNLPELRISANASRFESAVRISRIVSESFQQNLSDIRWFVMGDDDTIFFPDNLAYLLRKYDHRRFFYIGHPSESQTQSAFHSFSMAFGGGGFAISYALAERLSQMEDQCLVRYPQLYGSDSRIEACTAELGVPLTRERGFHQIDLRGDIFGLLAAHPVAPFVSLHHVDAIEPIFPNLKQLEALRHLLRSFAIDPLGLLQQSFCYDTIRNVTFSISSGYAVQVFAGMLTPLELQRPAVTFLEWRFWKAEADSFTFSVRPFAADSCSNPFVYYIHDMQRAINETEKSIATFHRSSLWRSANCPDFPVPTTIKVLKEHHSESWALNPRRQCCEVVPSSSSGIGGGEQEDARWMSVRVRHCRPNEIIAPPR